jgi:hypothetical protein
MQFGFTAKSLRFVVVSMTLLIGSTAIGSESLYKHEITGGVDATSGFMRIYVGTSNYIQYSFTGSYSYSLNRPFQLGLQAAISNSGAVIDSFRYSFYVPFTMNWGGEDLRNDFFAKISPGISYTNALNTALLVQFGKRFKLLENFSWRPTIGLNANFGNGDPRTAIDIIPVVFSVIF